MRSRRVAHRSGSLGRHAPEVELQRAVGGARLGEGRVRTGRLGELGRTPQGVEVDLLGEARRDDLGLLGVEGQPQLEERVLETHHARGRPGASGRWRPSDSGVG